MTAPRPPLAGAGVRHLRDFFAAVGAGSAVWLLAATAPPALRALLAADVFFALYIGQMVMQAVRLDAADLRARGGVLREGGLTVLIVTAAAVALSLVAIFLLLNRDGPRGALFATVALASVPLAWATLHTHAAFQYARLYYDPTPAGLPSGGLAFPGGADPDALDILYYALVVGVSTSVSDVSITSRRMRLATLAHSLAAFAFNTVLIAIAMNAALAFAG